MADKKTDDDATTTRVLLMEFRMPVGVVPEHMQ